MVFILALLGCIISAVTFSAPLFYFGYYGWGAFVWAITSVPSFFILLVIMAVREEEEPKKAKKIKNSKIGDLTKVLKICPKKAAKFQEN